MKKGELKKGFKPLRAKLEDSPGAMKAIRDCSNCQAFFSIRSAKEEICNDTNVTEYDMTYEENGRIYCTFWKPIGTRPK